MDDKEILEKAIQKAIDGGWTGGKHLNWSGDWMGQVPKLEIIQPFPSWPRLKYTTGGVNVEEYTYPPMVMLFDHDFAKALWGEDIRSFNMIVADASVPEWKYRLSQMVIADNPIQYLGENI